MLLITFYLKFVKIYFIVCKQRKRIVNKYVNKYVNNFVNKFFIFSKK